MKKNLLFLIAAALLTQTIPQMAACYAADDTPEVKFPASETFRTFYESWNDFADDQENGVKGQHIKMTVTPTELPYPLLKYRFNTYVNEMESGNAAPLYSEAYARFRDIEQRTMRNKVYESQEYAKAKWPEAFNIPPEKRDDDMIKKLQFQAFPLKPHWTKESWTLIDASQEEELYKNLNEVYRFIEKASKKRDCDWSYQIEYRGLYTLLPHIQNLRTLARYLDGKAEWEIRNGKYDDAVKTIRLGLRLAEHLESSDYPYLVTELVAIAIKGIMFNKIQLLSAQPDSPNLYPALTQIVYRSDIYQKSLQMEQYMWFNRSDMQEMMERMDENNREDCKILLDAVVATFGRGAFANNNFETTQQDRMNQVITAACLICYPHGKERLLKRGLTETEIEKLSVYQVVTPYILEEIKGAYDKMIVAALFPLGSKHTAIEFSSDDYGIQRADSPVNVYLSLLLPAATAAKNAFLRMEQNLDLMKITEAIRYYAAVNGGKLPESLEQIEQLYVKTVGVVNNKPFGYRVEGNTAIIDYVLSGVGESRLEITVEKIADRKE
ncbi:MAG: hypothetical protein LBJ67_09390 [Planctomycetaceae bacterium]|jgi:hypothetical protein|nr:hypothetical protein [Planctomycetaceae bacterium]